MKISKTTTLAISLIELIIIILFFIGKLPLWSLVVAPTFYCLLWIWLMIFVWDKKPRPLWKEALKSTTINFGKDLLSFCYIVIIVLFVLHKQSPEQLKAIELIFQEKDWTMIVIILSGVAGVTFIIQQLLNFIFKIIKILINGKTND